jgi:5-methylcytosine-specific restriction endonuclease McrA
MKICKTNAVHIWKQIEDVLVPRLCLTLAERAVYSHLLRHSRLEDRLRLRFSILWLARGNRLSAGSVRLRRLVAKGALRLVERTKAGHVVEVRLPGEIRAVRPERGARGPARLPRTANLEEMDFWQDKTLREAIHARERSVCFYCLRRLTARVRCLDHVVPQVRRGSNSYRNIVSSCAECNALKGETPAEGFLRSLYRDGRLTAPNSLGGCGRPKRLRRGSSGPRCTAGTQRTRGSMLLQDRFCGNECLRGQRD